MKRIICTVSNDLNYDQRMHRICTTLANEGYEVTLVGRKRKNSIPPQKRPFQQIRLKLPAEKGKLFYCWLNVYLFFYLLFKKADVLNAVDLDTILPCLLAGKIRRIPVVYDAHEYFTEVPEVINRPITKKIWEKIEGFAVPKCREVYTVSKSIAGILEGKYHREVNVVRNLPVLSETKLSKNKTNIILYQGALNEGRGIETLIKSMMFLEAKLQIAGDGDLSDELRELVTQLNLRDKVEFLGYKRPEELMPITARAGVGINILENTGLSYYYSLSNKFFDYIHAGVPSVTIRFPEYEIINDQFEVALLIDDIKPETIAAAVKLLLEDHALYARLKQNCLRARQILNWQKENEKIKAIYRKL